MAKPKAKKRSAYDLFLWVPFGILVTFVGGALIWNIGISTVRWFGYGPIKKFVGFGNYQEIFADTKFWESFGHAFLFVIPMAIIPTVLGLLIASLMFDFLSKNYASKVATFIRSSLYLPQIIPIMITGIIWRWIIDPEQGSLNVLLKSIGLKDLALNWTSDPFAATLAISFVLLWIQLGYTVVIFLSGLSRLNPYVIEAAHMDGANWWQRSRYITTRELSPEIAVVLLTSVVGALKVFAPIYYITGGGPEGATTVPSIYSFNAFFGGNRVGYASAVTVLLAIVITLVALILVRVQRRQIRGEE
jgi:raffinose/stachyose/melibiose transport system permease protein